MYFVVDVLKSDENKLKEIITAQRQSAYVPLYYFLFYQFFYWPFPALILLT